MRLFGGAAPSEVAVEPVGARAVLVVDGVAAGALEAGQRVTLSKLGHDVRARFNGADVSGRTVRVEGERLRLRAGRVDREYPGPIVGLLEDGKLTVVDHAPMEPYVASVVASEFGFSEIEGAKAQAVLVRTYAARRLGANADYDLDDDQSSQVFRGLGETTSSSLRAAQETAGQVLTYRGALADAYYFSSSGGHTADNDAVWDGPPIPYLRGVPDPYDTASPDNTWRTTASRSAVLRTLSQRYGGTVTGVDVERRSRSGRVRTVRLVGASRATISGSQFRRAVDAAAGPRTVRSTKFELSVEGDRYVFRGGGYGHGVGLSQFGALGQARAGRDYREILTYYFQGTTVEGGSVFPTAPAYEPLAAAAPGAPSDAVPREPSALRTRYAPPTARRWPTPRRLVRDADEPAAEAAAAPVERPTPPASASRTQPEPRSRRTAW